ncbi:MAG: DUF433 domain-containing protein [Dehalococcoidia bacterium]
MTTEIAVNIGTLIYSRPDLHDGRPCLAGSGVLVQEVAARHQTGLSAEQIQADFPDLDISLFYAALAYYYANRTQINRALDEDEALYWKLEAESRAGLRPPRSGAR